MNVPARPALVLFDCDGVLVDSEPIACAAVAQALCERGLALGTADVIERYVGWSAASMYADLERRHGLVVDDESRRQINRGVDARLAAQVEAMPGIDVALAALQAAGVRFCVASSGTHERIRGSLTRAGLWPCMDGRVYSATEVARGKPAPDLFLHAASRQGVAPAQCLVVEDSLAGVTAAVAAGMRCVGFVGGAHVGPGHAERLRAAGAGWIVADMAQLGVVAPLALTAQARPPA